MVVRRYRCAACGNITRFDVTSTRRTRAFHHYTVGGALVVEDEEVLDDTVEDVSCRWCGHGQAVEVLGDEGLPDAERLVSVPVRSAGRPAADVEGTGLAGEPFSVRAGELAGPTLLLFLSLDCEGCDDLWSAWADPGRLGLAADQVLAVTRPAGDGETRRLDALVARSEAEEPDRRLVASESAWRAYGVHGAPFYVVVDDATVVAEGVPLGADQLRSVLERSASAPGASA